MLLKDMSNICMKTAANGIRFQMYIILMKLPRKFMKK